MDKVYLKPGDVVRLNKPLSNLPNMYILRKEILNFKKGEKAFLGMRCRWFNNNLDLCEAVFDTKDLDLIEL